MNNRLAKIIVYSLAGIIVILLLVLAFVPAK